MVVNLDICRNWSECGVWVSDGATRCCGDRWWRPVRRHAADYRSPEPYTGKRVVVVGGGNTAVQVGCELAEVARVTLASRDPVQFLAQIREGRDVHHWLRRSHLRSGVGRLGSRPDPARHRFRRRVDGEAGRGAEGGMRAGAEVVHQCCLTLVLVLIADGANFLRQARAT
ncbi:hypothetical protein [Streptomyces sp. NPDC088180]|uniref:hypothetical protein n=1 Tax=Streptomyces sp. NPDC088180 TaxID=3365837 RepID=UPI00380FB70C